MPDFVGVITLETMSDLTTAVIARIDSELARAQEQICLCGCGEPLDPNGHSLYFASEECQDVFTASPSA